jgi:hypothetical protein
VTARAIERAAALVLAAALAGCGETVPHAPELARAAPAAPAVRGAPGEGEAAGTSRAGATVSPVATIARFATVYINWDAHDVAARLDALAAASIGQARSAMELAAAETRGDPTLARGGIANEGRVEAVAPRSGHPDQYVVVTLESTVASNTAAYEGLAPAWHLTVATVAADNEADSAGWVISGWQPES